MQSSPGPGSTYSIRPAPQGSKSPQISSSCYLCQSKNFVLSIFCTTWARAPDFVIDSGRSACPNLGIHQWSHPRSNVSPRGPRAWHETSPESVRSWEWPLLASQLLAAMYIISNDGYLTILGDFSKCSIGSQIKAVAATVEVVVSSPWLIVL